MKANPVVLILAEGDSSRRGPAGFLAFRPMLGRSSAAIVLDAALRLRPRRIFLTCSERSAGIPEFFSESGVEKLDLGGGFGAGAALLAARAVMKKDVEGDILVLPAARPLLTPESLKTLLGKHRKEKNLVTVLVPDGVPKECTAADVSASVCLFRAGDLFRTLAKMPKRGLGAISLDAVVRLLAMNGKSGVSRTRGGEELFQIAEGSDLASAASVLRFRKIRELADRDVTVLDPASTWIDLDVRVGRGTIIYPSTVIEGRTRIGNDCLIYPHVHIMNARIGNSVRILGATVLEDCILENGVQAGPFSRIRPASVLKSGSRVGNFVETKKTTLGKGSKALHLSYLGDADIGESVNIGAGTITCNYDGARKNPTVIEKGVFIGSGTELVAPIRVGKGAYVGAGSTITSDVEPGALALARARQVQIPGWVKRRAAKKAGKK
jgi:bifunctional UDP-N-acetylglucosamine pyrophosphorylase / glucosamine-1-phosphate N-acetyltransferase